MGRMVMKLFEDMAEMGATINEIVQKIINDVYREELDDDQINEIVQGLSLSDMLELDRAYTDNDQEAIRSIIGPLPQMEYSMGSGRQATSAASSRPAPRTAGGQQASKKPGTQNTTQTNRNYSGGVQNGVSTTNVDNEDDPDQVVQDGEPIEEDSAIDSPPHFSSLKVISDWKPAAKPQGSGQMTAIMQSTLTGDEYELNWLPEDPDWISWAEVVFSRNGKPMYGNSGNDSIEDFESILVQDEDEDDWDEEEDDEFEESYVGAPDRSPARGGRSDEHDLQQLAQEYQAAMAGMGRRDEQDIIDDMYAIADPDTVDDILNGVGVDTPRFEETAVTENTADLNSEEVIRALLQAADDEHIAGLERLATRINQSFPDSVTVSDIMNMLNEPQLRGLRRDDVEYALHASGLMDVMEDTPVEEEKLDKAGAESIIRDMADRYQAAMAGMSNEDEWEILDQAEELAKKYGVDLDMYFESRYESPEQKVIQMKEWLKRRAGIA